MDASSPRVYMPVSHPDSPASMQAALQLVGGQPDLSLQVPNFAHASTASRSSPSSNRGSQQTAADSRDGIALRAGLMDPLKPNAACNSGLLMEAEGLSTQENRSPDNSSVGNPSPQSSSTGPNMNIGMKKCSKVGSTGGSITVSHTEKETIVHTDSSNFREVVHQLTGASADDVDLLPVTIPSRAPPNRGNGDDANRCVSKQDPFVMCDFTGRLSEFGVHKPVPMKLFERRRSSKTLERISTSCRELPPLVPSPVTPLASDFERICLPVSPINSSMVPAQERSYVQMHCTSSLRQNGNVQVYSGYNQPAMYMSSNSSQSQLIAKNLYTVGSEPHNVEYIAQEASIEDFAIAEKGFFLHPQRPKNSEPALLSLFPESPRDQ